MDQALAQIVALSNLTVSLGRDDSLTLPLLALGGRGPWCRSLGNIVPRDRQGALLAGPSRRGTSRRPQEKWH